jgi:uncharacterized lipoprotein YmbA
MARAQTVPPAATPPQEVPQWVIRYASGQEQAARSCQILLAQEQTKTDDLTKQLADAKSALAATKPAEPAKK